VDEWALRKHSSPAVPSDDTKGLTATCAAPACSTVATSKGTIDAEIVFETLQLLRDGQTVVLVTSGNPTFDTEGPRKQLLSALNAIQNRLREKARQ